MQTTTTITTPTYLAMFLYFCAPSKYPTNQSQQTYCAIGQSDCARNYFRWIFHMYTNADHFGLFYFSFFFLLSLWVNVPIAQATYAWSVHIRIGNDVLCVFAKFARGSKFVWVCEISFVKCFFFLSFYCFSVIRINFCYRTFSKSDIKWNKFDM